MLFISFIFYDVYSHKNISILQLLYFIRFCVACSLAFPLKYENVLGNAIHDLGSHFKINLPKMWQITILLLTLCSQLFSVHGGTSRRYHAHDLVNVAANTVGPFNNPTETYPVSATLFLINLF